MSNYTDLRDKLTREMCSECAGAGTYDDADCGDMYYKTYECNACSGTGFSGQELALRTSERMVNG